MIATVTNMRLAAEKHPGQRIVMLDSLGNEWSATPGDYFQIPDDEPLLDEDGDPMVLAIPEPGTFRDIDS